MIKVIKNAHIFFLWLAWLILTAHVIIPHDHHLTDSSVTQDEKCPASEGNTGHNSGFPIHCNAFNTFESEKTRPFNINQSIQKSVIEYCSISDSFSLKLQFTRTISFDFREPFPDSYLLMFSPLRAPPSFS